MRTAGKARFQIGQLVRHRLFDYRGVIFDVDPVFSLTDEWYNKMARSKPPRNKPWYSVLVNNASHSTYVAEQNLNSDTSSISINHPMVDQLFSGMKKDLYIKRTYTN